MHGRPALVGLNLLDGDGRYANALRKREQRVSIPYAVLLEHLDAALDALNERSPGIYPLGAATYLKQWSDEEHQLLRIIFAAVEQNFRAIACNGQEQQLRREARKGTVVGYVLDPDAERTLP